MRGSLATMASRSPTRAAWAASIWPTVASRYGLPSSGGSIGHMLEPSVAALYSAPQMWKMEAHEVRGRAPSFPAPRRGRDPTHGVGDPRDAHGQVPRVPAGAGAAGGGGRGEAAHAHAERQHSHRQCDM